MYRLERPGRGVLRSPVDRALRKARSALGHRFLEKRDMRHERRKFGRWVEETLRLHERYGLSRREIRLTGDHLFIKSAHGVWFGYVPGLGLRHMEMNGTNDRVQVEFILNNFPEDGVLLDIGASYGYYALTVAKAKPRSYVHAFEPAERSCDVFLLNCDENSLSNVCLVRSAVGDQPGRVSAVGSPADFGVAYVQPEDASAGYSIPCITIDQYVAQQRISRVDYIKIDIEGGELPALRGGLETVRRFEPIIQCELVGGFSLPRFGYRTSEVTALMEEWGYGFLYLTHDQNLREYGPLLVGADPMQALRAATEFFFVPRGRIESLNLKTRFTTAVPFPYIV